MAKRIKGCTRDELRKVNVRLLDGPSREYIGLVCDNCGNVWYPAPWAQTRLPKGYWLCPNGCNIELYQQQS